MKIKKTRERKGRRRPELDNGGKVLIAGGMGHVQLQGNHRKCG